MALGLKPARSVRCARPATTRSQPSSLPLNSVVLAGTHAGLGAECGWECRRPGGVRGLSQEMTAMDGQAAEALLTRGEAREDGRIQRLGGAVLPQRHATRRHAP